MLNLRRELKKLDKEELQVLLEDIFVDNEEEFDVYSGGYSKNSYQDHFYEEDIDLGCELTIISREQVLNQLKVIDNQLYIKCTDDYRKIDMHYNKKSGRYNLLLFPDYIKGELAVDMLRYWFNYCADYKIISESENWTTYKIRLSNNIMVWSVHDSGKYCTLTDYNAWKHYYSRLLKNDGQRRKQHKYSSCNIHKPQQYSDIYGDLGAMFGGSFDDQVQENIDKAIDLLEEYGYRVEKE